MIDVLAAIRSLSTPKRLRLLLLLSRGKFCSCHLAEALRVPEDSIAPDLKVLTRSGLVSWTNHAYYKFYSLSTAASHPRQQLILQWAIKSLEDDRIIQQDLKQLRAVLNAPAVRRCDPYREVWPKDAPPHPDVQE